MQLCGLCLVICAFLVFIFIYETVLALCSIPYFDLFCD